MDLKKIYSSIFWKFKHNCKNFTAPPNPGKCCSKVKFSSAEGINANFPEFVGEYSRVNTDVNGKFLSFLKNILNNIVSNKKIERIITGNLH